MTAALYSVLQEKEPVCKDALTMSMMAESRYIQKTVPKKRDAGMSPPHDLKDIDFKVLETSISETG